MATAQITSERIDDIPLLLQWLLDMHIDQIIDAVLKSPHGNRQGLSYGQLAVVFVAYVLTECNHFLSPVRDWVTKRQHTLTQALGCPIRDTDFTDERLEDLLEAVGRDEVGEALEAQLGQVREVLVEGPAAPPGWLQGLSDHYLRVTFPGPPAWHNRRVMVRIRGLSGETLTGEAEGEP